MSKSPIELIRHIIDEINYLERETVQYSESQFMHDETKQRAFARSLEIIGEAIKMIPDELKKQHSTIEWKAFAGLRDRLIHHYFGVDYALVWDVVIHELPELKQKLQPFIQE